MYKNKSILAIIPARGGSKGIPNKNIKPLLSKPLIYWSIREAKKSRYIDRIVVSTDSHAIARIAKSFGAEVPFLRPRRFSLDNSTSVDVVKHAVDFFELAGVNFDILILLQPTSPLRKYGDIDKAIRLFFQKRAESIISVTEASVFPSMMNTLPPDRSMNNFVRPDAVDKNRQSLPRYFQLNGAIFIVKTSYFKKSKSFYGDRTFAYLMPKERSVDIDDIIDFEYAELLLEKAAVSNK